MNAEVRRALNTHTFAPTASRRLTVWSIAAYMHVPDLWSKGMV
ncbi:MAG: hypothetical protein OXG46_04790 [Chloroflexi bacterium]|nr:hypothetical protein [Chloroflexota bacterium]